MSIHAREIGGNSRTRVPYESYRGVKVAHVCIICTCVPAMLQTAVASCSHGDAWLPDGTVPAYLRAAC
eukprot:SAG22_NODE_1113_length_5533_cov_5.884063_10_plen_68_part_00